MERITVALPDDLYEEFERLRKERRISRSRYGAMIFAYWIGRAEARDEVAALHERMNAFEARGRRA